MPGKHRSMMNRIPPELAELTAMLNHPLVASKPPLWYTPRCWEEWKGGWEMLT